MKSTIPFLIIVMLASSCVPFSNFLVKIGVGKKDRELRALLATQKQLANKNIAMLDSMQTNINDNLKTNPNSTSAELLPTLLALKDSLQTIVNDIADKESQKKLDFNSMLDYSNLLNEKLNRLTEKNVIVETAVRNTSEITLKSDISFVTGRYDLRTDGISVLKIVVSEIEKKIIKWNTIKNGAYRYYPKKITVIVVGYADLQGASNINLRKKTNLDLSEKRSATVANFLNDELTRLKDNYNIEIRLINKGLGEELPPNIKDTWSIDNPNRRICLISTNVSLILN